MCRRAAKVSLGSIWAPLLVALVGCCLERAAAQDQGEQTTTCLQHLKNATSFNESLARCQEDVSEPAANHYHQQQQQQQLSTTWYFRYIDELVGERSKVLLEESSPDQRLANLFYLTNSIRFTEFDTSRFNSGDERTDELMMELVAGGEVDEATCSRHLSQILELLDEHIEWLRMERTSNSSSGLKEQHVQLIRVLDSFGRYESGTLLGQTQFYGSAEECQIGDLQLPRRTGEHGLESVPMRFCWANLDYSGSLNEHLKRRPVAPLEFERKIIKTAACLPRSCHSKSFTSETNKRLAKRLIDSQFKLPESLYLGGNLKLDSIYCSPDATGGQGLALSGKLFLLVAFAWACLTLYATLVRREAPESHFLKCLDLRESFCDLVEWSNSGHQQRQPPVRGGKIELDSLNPVKVLGCAFVVLGHALIFWCATLNGLLRVYARFESEPFFTIMALGTAVVDTFFVISGLLIGYLAMRRANRPPRAEEGTTSGGGSFLRHCLNFALTRYLRLVPLPFLWFWFKRSVLIHLFAEWPLRDHGFNQRTSTGACQRESWLSPLTLQSAFLPLSAQCIPQCWSVSTDLFFSLTIGPIALIMTKRPRAALALGLALAAASLALTWSTFEAIDPEETNELRELRTHGIAQTFSRISYMYTYPHFRFASILIGLLAGFVLFHYERAEELKEWPQWFKSAATKSSILTILFFFAVLPNVSFLKHTISPYHRLIVNNIYTTARVLWAASNAILMMRMVSDWRSSLPMQMAASKFWRVLVKLNFVILIVHLDYLWLYVFNQTNGNNYSRLILFSLFAGAYLTCLASGLFFYVTLENPIGKLIKRYVMPKIL